MKDLHNPKLMWLKAILFLVIGCTSGVVVWFQARGLITFFLLILTVWAFCRAYYFAFYVLEKYVDPGFHYSGLGSLIRHVLRGRGRQ